MKVLKKMIHYLDNVVDMGMFLIFLLFFLMGLYALYDSYLVYMDANGDDLLHFKPGYETGEEEREIKGNMVAWLTIDDTKIDYPVMQGKDNNEYLNKDPFGDYSLSGSIFLDSRNAEDFSDEYSLTYGHHMEHGMMFGALDKFLDEDYCNTHHTGSLIVGEETYPLRIFAVLETDATNEAIFAPTETDVETTLSYIKMHSVYLDETKLPKKGERLFAMSTCKYPDTVDRTVVISVLESPVH